MTRAGAVSLYTDLSGVVLCGGRNGAGQVLGDCLQYNLTSHMVSSQTTIFSSQMHVVFGSDRSPRSQDVRLCVSVSV